MSDLRECPVDELLAVAARYRVSVRPLAPGRVEVIAPPDASPVARAVAGRLRTRATEIAAALAASSRPVRPCRVAA